MNIHIISHLFPNDQVPYQGKFIKDQADLLASTNSVKVSLSVPTPYSIPFTGRHRLNSSPLLQKNYPGERVQYLSIPKRKLPSVTQFFLERSYKKIFDGNEYQLVHIHFLSPDGLLIPYLEQKGIKTVLTIHGGDYYRLADRPEYKPLIDQIITSVNKVLLVGPTLLQDLKESYPNQLSKFHQINNFIDEDIYTTPTDSDKQNLRNTLGWNPDKIHFLCVANNRPEKGVDILFDAMSKIQELSKSVHIHLVGNLDDSFREVNLQPDPMITVHDPMSASELLKFYKGSDAYILPSRKEGFGLAMIEAAAVGLPVIANKTGIAGEFIDEKTGILNKDFSPETLANSIFQFIENKNQFSSEYIRSKVISNFGKQIFLDNLMSVYQEVSNE